MTDSVALQMRAYLSMQHLFGAVHFARLSREIEERHGGRSKFCYEHRAYAIGSVLCAVAFLEATINELFSDAVDSPGALNELDPSTRDLMANLWTLEVPRTASFPILKKYQIALALGGRARFDEGRQPYQDAQLLVQLRNALVHYEPEWLPPPSSPHRFELSLKQKFPASALFAGSGNPYFPDHCLGYGCASWAVKSAVAFEDEFFCRMGLKGRYQAMRPELELLLP